MKFKKGYTKINESLDGVLTFYSNSEDTIFIFRMSGIMETEEFNKEKQRMEEYFYFVFSVLRESNLSYLFEVSFYTKTPIFTKEDLIKEIIKEIEKNHPEKIKGVKNA